MIQSPSGIRKLIFLGGFFVWNTTAYAASAVDFQQALQNIPDFLSPAVVNAAVKTFGILLDHRPFEPATPLGPQGLDLGIQVNLVQTTTILSDALKTSGFDIPIPPALPNLRLLNVHKGMSEYVDWGGSYLSYMGFTVWALEMKIMVFQPEEGATWSVRMSYNHASIPIGEAEFGPAKFALDMSVTTWTPQIVISKKLEFADPYIGVGYQYTTGSINVETTLGPLIPGIETKSGSGGALLSFLGLSLRVPGLGFRITMEGAYSPEGFNSLGTKIGFQF